MDVEGGDRGHAAVGMACRRNINTNSVGFGWVELSFNSAAGHAIIAAFLNYASTVYCFQTHR